jgi:hypothetical protein
MLDLSQNEENVGLKSLKLPFLCRKWMIAMMKTGVTLEFEVFHFQSNPNISTNKNVRWMHQNTMWVRWF